MDVTREVIMDLLPVYLSGDASPATRVLVEEYMKQDSELAQRIRLQWAEGLAKITPSAPPPDLELKSLRRARRLLGRQRWLFAFGVIFTVLSVTNKVEFAGLHLTEFHFVLRDYPVAFGIYATLALMCWTFYFSIRRRLRTN